MRKGIIISFALTLFLSQASRAEVQEYTFEAFTKALKEVTGEPFQTMNMEGIKSHTYIYSGSFDSISEKARTVIKQMGIQEMSAKEKALTDSAFGAAFDSMDKSAANVKGRLMYKIDPGTRLNIMLMETSGMNMLIVQEVASDELTVDAGSSLRAEVNGVSIKADDRGMRIAQGDLSAATNEVERFHALNHAAKNALKGGDLDTAEGLANELARLATKYTNDWNYGNAIQDVNVVLGRIAVRKGEIEKARNHLLEAGKSPGSPQMDTFGPNMSLARDLLEQGEKEVVLEYFELCRNFWKMHRGRLDAWATTVNDGGMPDFGANLAY